MTKKGLNAFARVLVVIALLSIFLPFVKVEGNYVFGGFLFEEYSVEALLDFADPYIAGPNIFYILGVVAIIAALVFTFIRKSFKAIAVFASSIVSAVMFSLVGITFDSTYSMNYSLASDGINFTLDVGWYLTTFGMVAVAAINAVVMIFGKKMLDEKQISEVQRRNNKGWWFVAPFVIGFICFYLQPLVMSIWYTFNTFKLDTASGAGFVLEWAGLSNYKYIFGKQTTFWTTLVNTIGDMLISVPIIIIFSIFLAVILNQKFHGRTLVRAIFFMPVVVTGGIVMGVISGDTVTSAMTSGVETTSTTSIFAATGLMEILEGMNLPEEVINVFSSIVSSIFDTLWKCGVQILLFLSALQGIPPHLYEAARIEGATGWEMFWKVTFPNLVPFILVNIVYSIIDSLTDTTNLVMKAIEDMAFVKLSYHNACIEAWIFFLVLLAIVGIVFGVFALINRNNQPKPAKGVR